MSELDSDEPDSVIERYEEIWRKRQYAFSQGTSGEKTTPLLEGLIESKKLNSKGLSNRRNGFRFSVIEGGPGHGTHSIQLAKRDNLYVTAVESSETAVGIIKYNLKKATLANDSKVEVANEDLVECLEYLKGSEAGKHDAFYANALFHVFPPEKRAEAYSLLREVLTPGGLIAISFKAKGDALEPTGTIIEEAESGNLVRDRVDGIERLFVARPGRIADEIRAAGYNVKKVLNWSIPDYNLKQGDGKFVGFIAETVQR